MTAAPSARERRLLGAADSAWLAGQGQKALELLEAVGPLPSDPSLRAEAAALAARIALYMGEIDKARSLAETAAQLFGDAAPTKGVRILAEWAIGAFGSGQPGDWLRTGRLALAIASRQEAPAGHIYAHVAYGAAAIVAGVGDEGPRHLRRAAELFGPDPDLGDDSVLMMCAAIVGLFLREAEAGRELLDKALVSARLKAPVAALPGVLFYLARDAATTDRWSESRASYEEGARLATETGLAIWLQAATAGLSWLDALEGREEAHARAHSVIVFAERHDVWVLKGWALTALGLLEQGRGHADLAISHLRKLQNLLDEVGIGDPDLSPDPDLVDLLVRTGNVSEAVPIAEAYAARATSKGQPFALARAARALAQVAPSDHFAEHFEMALHHHGRTLDTFETARTMLCYGERLRRAKRKREARRQLGDALQAFRRLGAAPWVERALAELSAAGSAGGRSDPVARHRLTPQELQVGLSLAGAATVRETAAKLFLSPKTVEYHLRNVYDKLDVRSRDQLRTALGGSASPDTD